jgi:hypothetical protein
MRWFCGCYGHCHSRFSPAPHSGAHWRLIQSDGKLVARILAPSVESPAPKPDLTSFSEPLTRFRAAGWALADVSLDWSQLAAQKTSASIDSEQLAVARTFASINFW